MQYKYRPLSDYVRDSSLEDENQNKAVISPN